MWEAASIVPVKHQTYGQEAAVVPQGTHLDLPVWAAGIPTRHGIRFCGAIRARFDFANPVAGKPAGSALARLCVLTVQAALAWATPAQSRARRT